MSHFCFKRTCAIILDKIIETLLVLVLLALAGIPAFAFTTRLLLGLFDRGTLPSIP